MLAQKVQSMKDELDIFCKTLEPSHFMAAVQLKNALEDEGHPQDDMRIYTKDLYKQGFQFPSVAEYENVQA